MKQKVSPVAAIAVIVVLIGIVAFALKQSAKNDLGSGADSSSTVPADVSEKLQKLSGGPTGPPRANGGQQGGTTAPGTGGFTAPPSGGMTAPPSGGQ